MIFNVPRHVIKNESDVDDPLSTRNNLFSKVADSTPLDDVQQCKRFNAETRLFPSQGKENKCPMFYYQFHFIQMIQ